MKSITKALVLLMLASILPVLIQAQISNFQHIVIVYQENRTPDNLFQGLCGTNLSKCPVPYDIQDFGIDNQGQTVQLTQVPLGSPFDPDHSHHGFVTMCDLDPATNQCRMDGLSNSGCNTNSCSFEYVNPADVAPYITMAQQYGWANFMFQTNQGPSTPSHQFIFGGTSAAIASDDSSAIFVAENHGGKGCLNPLNSIYKMISPESAPNEFKLINNPKGTVCFSRETMATLLDKHNLSWKYYTPGENNIWTAPNWIRQICQPDNKYTQCSGAEWKNDVDLNPAEVLKDIAKPLCDLPNVVWVIPTGQNSDHPGANGNTGGPSWVSSIVNGIGQSKCTDTEGNQTLTYWQDTAILLTWDDWGGWYDHEPPTLLSVPTQGQGDYQYGFRVPLIVISAYTPKGYVNSNRHDFGSILRFIEQNFRLGDLGFADTRCDPSWVDCALDNLHAFFNLGGSPRTFTKIPAPLGEEFFLNDKRPMEPPDTD